MSNKRKIACLSLSEMERKCNNKELAEYIYNFKSNNMSSAPETTVIACIMSFFMPLSFKKISGTNVIINGRHGEYIVNFQLQEKIYNPNTKKTLSSDLTIKLFHSDYNDPIAKVGIEYDGHSEHINSYGILNDKKKDLSVLKQTGMPRIRIHPEFFQSNEEKKDVYRAIKKYFEQYIKLIPKKKRNAKCDITYITCLLCEGVEVLGAHSCPVCLGCGSVKKNTLIGLDVEVFDTFDCPDCSKRTVKKCQKCRGTGFLSREEAIKIRREELNRT